MEKIVNIVNNKLVFFKSLTRPNKAKNKIEKDINAIINGLYIEYIDTSSIFIVNNKRKYANRKRKGVAT